VVPKEIIEEQDEPGVPVPEGSKCKRRGCGVEFGSEKEECVYHPGVVSPSFAKLDFPHAEEDEDAYPVF